MKKFICLICCSFFVFVSGCKQESYLETIQSTDEKSAESVEDSVNADTKTLDASTIFVQVAGAVENPGVYELEPNSRVFQAIEAAGGLTKKAEDSDLNQAMVLNDGEKIYVFSKGEKAKLEQEAEASSSDSALLNINSASAEDFQTLPGIGQTKANQIVSYRDENGDFKNIEDIKNVSGIGDSTFSQIESLITI